MRDLLWFEWERDLGGYSIELMSPEQSAEESNRRQVDRSDRKVEPSVRDGVIEDGFWPGKVIRLEDTYCLVPRGGDTLRYRPFELGVAIFREFAETERTHAGVEAFAAKYGRLGEHLSGLIWAFEPVEDWYKQIELLAAAVAKWDKCRESGDLSPLAQVFNRYNLGKVTIKFGAARFGERPRLRLEPASLLDGMWIQLGQMADGDVKLQRCDWCPTWFAVGPGTGRRSTAKFCSDTCRKASNRNEQGKK